MNWPRKKIVEWSEKTFPSLTKEQQLEKLELECREFTASQTPSQSLEELADICIVCAILEKRFNCSFAGIMSCTLINRYGQDLKDAIDIKMDINTSRTWALINGEYRHVD